MVIIEKVDQSRDAFGDYSLEGSVLTVGGISVELEAEQGEQEVIITLSDHNGMLHRGMMPCCNYVAEIIIPPRRYELIETPNEDMEGAEEQAVTRTEYVPVILDLDSVRLKLWPVTARREQNEGEM
jgi:hypothetical protein